MILLHRLFELPAIPLVICLIAFTGLLMLRVRHDRILAQAAAVHSTRWLTGGEAAIEMLHAAGLDTVNVAETGRAPTDYYDPVAAELRLSTPIHESASLAALAVVAHEAGHAVQDQHRTAIQRLIFRDRLACFLRLAPGTALLLFVCGFVLDLPSLETVGLLVLPLAVAVGCFGVGLERDASRRGRRLLAMCALMSSAQEPLLDRALEAAAWREVESLAPRVRPPAWRRSTAGSPSSSRALT